MSGEIEGWLERMRDARDPGPAMRIAIRRKGQLEGCVDLTVQADLAAVTDKIRRIVETGVPPRCELRALDLADRTIGFMRVGPSSQHAAHKRAADDLALAAIVEARRLTAALAAAMQAENVALREERRDLRLLLTLVELWHTERNQGS
jgi:hypothetical protein